MNVHSFNIGSDSGEFVDLKIIKVFQKGSSYNKGQIVRRYDDNKIFIADSNIMNAQSLDDGFSEIDDYVFQRADYASVLSKEDLKSLYDDYGAVYLCDNDGVFFVTEKMSETYVANSAKINDLNNISVSFVDDTSDDTENVEVSKNNHSHTTSRINFNELDGYYTMVIPSKIYY